jgi:hypothetical protein
VPNRQTDSPNEFSTKADNFTSALPTFGSEANTLAQFCNDAAASVSGIGLAAFFNIELADTSDSDPGNGKVKFSNATQRSAAELYLDDQDAGGASVRDQIAKFDDSTSAVKGDLSLRKRDDKTKWLVFEVTGITQKSGYTVVTVQNGDGSAVAPFADADEVVLGFTRTGDAGADGADGADGAAGTSVTISANDTTSDYLKNKLVAGSNITLTEQNDGGDETLSVAVSGLGTAATKNVGTGSSNVPQNSDLGSQAYNDQHIAGSSQNTNNGDITYVV